MGMQIHFMFLCFPENSEHVAKTSVALEELEARQNFADLVEEGDTSTIQQQDNVPSHTEEVDSDFSATRDGSEGHGDLCDATGDSVNTLLDLESHMAKEDELEEILREAETGRDDCEFFKA